MSEANRGGNVVVNVVCHPIEGKKMTHKGECPDKLLAR